MKPNHLSYSWFPGFLLFFFLLPAFLFADVPVVIVCNDRDADSVALAEYYAKKRGIPRNRIVTLSCPPVETISRADYDNTIATPLREIFNKRGWWKTEADLINGRVTSNNIKYLALIRGIPLRIASVPAGEYPGDKPAPEGSSFVPNEAAVDSELAVLGLATRQITGPLKNPAFQGPPPPPAEPASWLLRVCRLDAPEPVTVRRMIDDSLAAEKTGLWGFAYIDARGLTEGGLAMGDQWLHSAADNLLKSGVPCILDNIEPLFPEHYPITRAAFYLGWYSQEIAGALADPDFRFLPGAIAVHIHSFSAVSLRAGQREGEKIPARLWCAALLDRGAAATLGNVFEPYLMLTPRLDVFQKELSNGAAFADAAYAAQPVLSWMTTFIGDPLYRPFANRKSSSAIVEYAVFADGAKRWIANRATGEAWLKQNAKILNSGVLWEGLGLLQMHYAKAPDAALDSWKQARQAYRADADRIRSAVLAITLLNAQKKGIEALALTREQIARNPTAPAAEHLRNIERKLVPPPPVPPPKE